MRGYQQSQFLGDNGYSASAEFRWLPTLKRRDLQLALFVDNGGGDILKPLPKQISSVNLTGAGVGLRFDVGPNTNW